jgi:hypothetical protein
MKTLNIKSSAILLTLGFIMGFSLLFLFSGNCNGPEINTELSISPAEQKKQIEKNEKEHQQAISELEKKNNELSRELATTKELLNNSKLKTKTRETKIKKLIEPKGLSAIELLAKVKPQSSSDTSVSICDSLINEVYGYIEDNAVRDSLYELQIIQFDSTISIKDSIISQKTWLNKELKFSLTRSLTQQEVLLEQNKQLKKKFKRQKFRRKLTAIGVTVLSGIAVDFLIRR